MENAMAKSERNGAPAASARSSEWRNLVSDVEDLIKKVANVDDEEVARMRARLEQTLAKAKSAARDGATSVRDYARDASTATDDYVRESPWMAVGVAAAVGVLVGFIVGRR